ncbi:hypothetical protein DK66_3102 [Brucella suis 1330]|nr:hypothetical protein DK66_3102 [Brucella suis 1330]
MLKNSESRFRAACYRAESPHHALQTFDIFDPFDCFRVTGINCFCRTMKVCKADLPDRRHQRNIRRVTSHTGAGNPVLNDVEGFHHHTGNAEARFLFAMHCLRH